MTTLLWLGQQISASVRDDNNEPVERNIIGMTRGVAIMIGILTVVFGIPAAYLSWTTNAMLEWNVFFKVLFAIIAFFYGIEYILLYVIFKYDLVLELRRLKNGNLGWFWK